MSLVPPSPAQPTTFVCSRPCALRASTTPVAAEAVEANVTLSTGTLVEQTGNNPCSTVRQLGGTTRMVSGPRAFNPMR
jgi:hypothetical protein